VKAWINGRLLGEAALDPDAWTPLPPADLESDWNTCLLRWTPGGPGAALSHQWRNHLGRPEAEFTFR
jgi:hypothetical protein